MKLSDEDFDKIKRKLDKGDLPHSFSQDHHDPNRDKNSKWIFNRATYIFLFVLIGIIGFIGACLSFFQNKTTWNISLFMMGISVLGIIIIVMFAIDDRHDVNGDD